MAGQVGNPQNLTGQVANLGSTTLFTPTVSGMFRVTVQMALTTVDAVSSTFPKATLGWTDADSSQALTLDLTATSAGNVLTTISNGSALINAKVGVAITITTSGYVSNTPGVMAYSIRARVEAL